MVAIRVALGLPRVEVLTSVALKATGVSAFTALIEFVLIAEALGNRAP